MQVSGTQLQIATSNLDLREKAANSIKSSIEVYQKAIKALEKDTEAGVSGQRKAWLTVGIPTVPRKNDADYLSTTLESLLEELHMDITNPLYARVKVLVMNNQPGNHSIFYKVPNVDHLSSR